MEMHQIRYFLALSETLNFTKAAEQCNVAQPSLTRAIHSLEIELGGELLRRERSLSHLTELGERMVPLMRQCYDTAIAAKTVAQSMKKGETAPLALAISHTIDISLLAPILRELARAFPGLQLKLRRGSAQAVGEALKSGEVELAIAGPLGEAWARLDTHPLFDEPFDLFVARKHKLAARKSAEFADLASETMLVNAECDLAESFIASLRTKGIADTRAHRVANQDDLLALLEANFGIAVIPLGAAQSAAVSQVPLNGLDLARTVSIYSVAGRKRSTACATLLNMLRAADWGFDGAPEKKWGTR